MRIASDEEAKEIRRLAESKLQGLQPGVTRASSDDLLREVMNEIAEDLGVTLTHLGLRLSRAVHVLSKQDLLRIQRDPPSTSVSLVIHKEPECLGPELEVLGKADWVRALFFLTRTRGVDDLAHRLGDCPVFVAKDSEQAEAVAYELAERPFNAVLGAVNGTDVLVAYLGGRPT